MKLDIGSWWFTTDDMATWMSESFESDPPVVPGFSIEHDSSVEPNMGATWNEFVLTDDSTGKKFKMTVRFDIVPIDG